MAEEYIEPTRRQRLKIVLRALLVLALFLLIKIYNHRLVSFISEKPLCEQQFWWQFYLAFLLFIGLAIIYRYVRLGYLLLIHDQNPLPGTDVFFRTKIVRGWRVKLDALFAFVFAFGIFLGLIYLAQTKPISAMFTYQCVGA
jgi:hypothetical protein